MDFKKEYIKETGAKSIYRKTKLDTLVYDEEYVHWLQKKLKFESELKEQFGKMVTELIR